MRASVMRDFGPPEVLSIENIYEPSMGDGDVLVEVKAVTVNRTLDLAVRAGTYHIRPDL
ncbi:MAG: hypothetical protein JOZ39_07885, partial [Chloroflexi bacterium]|nr:hypothetical protein [Chloroflexota bacterium]